MFDNQLEIQRIEKSKELEKLGVKSYPHFLKREMGIKEFKEKFAWIKDLDSEKKKADEEVTIAGRLKLKRVAGKSTFANIEDQNDNIQIYYSKDSIGEENSKQTEEENNKN